ncbi:hypothetical protein [Polyangium jinanense]|uniref:Uncharacterized protein n=1 Tax=Polyangium jinanense TaxID=2829994 RepID=A0A9X3X4M6_9BACT|nr:hypothetical protein [Polyangium jinanense]MDC3954359.1 hypothetical protein [Polyangium jinanense]MDC3984189.1 hypothetical protein [Polyangium jinanense]
MDRKLRAAVLVACSMLPVACRSEPTRQESPIASASASAPPSAAVQPSAAPVEAPPPQVFAPDELHNAFQAELTATGFRGIVLKDASDAAKIQPPSFVAVESGSKPERIELPFSLAGDMKGGPHFMASNLSARRFLYAEGTLPKIRVRVWSNGEVGPPVEGQVPLFGGAAISTTQALVFFGKMDRRGFVDRPNAPRAALHRNGSWTMIDLPPPAEKDWHDCFWDAAARRNSEELVVLQICSAPRREMAYALYRLKGEAFSRIPFDNEVFNPVRAARGEFAVEEDGTIDLGSQVSGREEGEMTLARLRGGREPWKVVKVRMPTRLLSSVGASGDRLLFTDGGDDVRGSADGGDTFQKLAAFAPGPGSLGQCNRFGCSFVTSDAPGGGSRVFFRRWSTRAGSP